MRDLYANNPVNAPRLKTDKVFADYSNGYAYRGFLDDAMRYIEEFQLLSPTLWRRFVQQFREDSDAEGGWRGEYWGKMMRGACFVYSYTKNPELYEILKKTVVDMIESADEDGRISSYGRDHEFDAWDLWSRKYVLLGMQYFLEVCDDEALKERIVNSMRGQADYIVDHIGRKEDGKYPITKATRHWRGLNSCSILEPMVRLYSLTKDQKYLDFATYIVELGATDVANIFKMAYKNELPPYQYPVTKAYEMTSCFEGLIEYYRVMGEEWHKEAIINYADRILDSDFTVIGSAGCTHELFDHSTARQANTTNGKIQQETCVTVTLMKFFYQVYLLTGDSKYVDAFETALYNAYLGAVNTEKVIEPMIKEKHPDWALEPLPFDSYSPLTAGTRGNGVGGLKVMSDNHYYGCCACIGAAGIGLVPKMQLLSVDNGFVMNLYINGDITTTTPKGNKVKFVTETAYPKCGKITVKLELDTPEEFEISFRNPAWSKNTKIKAVGSGMAMDGGYITLNKLWETGDSIEITLDMRTEAIYPTPYGQELLMNKVIWGINSMVLTLDKEDPIAKNHVALRRGPLMLAQENRLGYSVDDAVEIEVDKDGYVAIEFPETDTAPYAHILEVLVPLKDGTKMTVTDYSSAGKLWTEESKMAVWMLTK